VMIALLTIMGGVFASKINHRPDNSKVVRGWYYWNGTIYVFIQITCTAVVGSFPCLTYTTYPLYLWNGSVYILYLPTQRYLDL
jgi:hypothetical protein